MAHYAFIDENNLVITVLTGVDETELIDGIEPEVWYSNQKKLMCKRTSYHGNIRKQYAGIGFTYDPVNDVFIAPKPYESWLLNDNFDWQAPKPKPEGEDWYWNEEEGEWLELLS